MNSCIIHIGMHKTGSTSIQYSLARLSTERFVYARLGRDPNHSLAGYTLFAADSSQHLLHRANNRTGPSLERFADNMRKYLEVAIASARGRTLILSGEDIGALRPDDVKTMAEFFQTHFDAITVVAYVRSPAAFMSSGFQQRVKSGALSAFALKNIYRNYQANFFKFDAAFGRENVRLWKFDPARFPDHDVVRDFCARLQIPLPQRRVVRVNDSLSRQVVALLYTYNKFRSSFDAPIMTAAVARKLVVRLQDIVAASSTQPFHLSPKIVLPILEENRHDIEWMERRLGESLDEPSGGARPADICSEADLLRPDPDVVDKLLEKLGNARPAGVKGKSPREIALLVHALRVKGEPGRFMRWLRANSLEAT